MFLCQKRNGIEFARTIPKKTLVVFTTAFHEFASESYEVDAIDYLIKPVKLERFQKAVEKAQTYCKLFHNDYINSNIENITDDYIFVRADRRMFKVHFSDILFIEENSKASTRLEEIPQAVTDFIHQCEAVIPELSREVSG